MSIELTSLSFLEKDLSPSEKHLLMILCFRADSKTFECWPSYKTLIDDSGYSRDTITRLISSLRDKGKIIDTGKRVGRTKLIHVYKVCIMKQSDSMTSCSHKQSDSRTVKQSDGRTVYEPKQSDGAVKQSDGLIVKQSDHRTRKDHIMKEKRKSDFFQNNKMQRQEKFMNSDGPNSLKEILEKLKTENEDYIHS